VRVTWGERSSSLSLFLPPAFLIDDDDDDDDDDDEDDDGLRFQLHGIERGYCSFN
jgi:hypothetical protein